MVLCSIRRRARSGSPEVGKQGSAGLASEVGTAGRSVPPSGGTNAPYQDTSGVKPPKRWQIHDRRSGSAQFREVSRQAGACRRALPPQPADHPRPGDHVHHLRCERKAWTDASRIPTPRSPPHRGSRITPGATYAANAASTPTTVHTRTTLNAANRLSVFDCNQPHDRLLATVRTTRLHSARADRAAASLRTR